MNDLTSLREALSRAATDHLAARAPDRPPLAWTITEYGSVTSCTADPATADGWARLLGLTAEWLPGVVMYSGDIDGVRALMECTYSQALYDAYMDLRFGQLEVTR